MGEVCQCHALSFAITANGTERIFPLHATKSPCQVDSRNDQRNKYTDCHSQLGQAIGIMYSAGWLPWGCNQGLPVHNHYIQLLSDLDSKSVRDALIVFAIVSNRMVVR